MDLKSVKISGFKSISNVELELTNTTLLVGPNNSGKSSVLQAIHFAARAASQAPEANKQSTISLREIEYVPSIFYKELANFSLWGNAAGSPESTVTFNFVDPADSTPHVAKVVLKAARNEGISINPQISPKLFPLFRSKDTTFSAYIPGLAGIPLSEELIAKRNVFRKAASGDSNVVLRNILRLIKLQGDMSLLRQYVNDVYAGIDFDVEFDENEDMTISSSIWGGSLGSQRKPIEFSGTGFLQVLQIFAYLVLFKPKIILMDEPESHLHPSLQTILVRKLQARVSSSATIALITTHSPFIARGLPVGAKTIWLDKGSVAAAVNDDTIRDALGWGALDKKIILCTEDNNVKLLNEILSQDESLLNLVAVVPFDGISKMGSAPILSRMRSALGGHHKFVVHRDRDCAVKDELDGWREDYAKHGIDNWITAGSDLEMYFCDPDYLAATIGISPSDAQSMIDSALHSGEERNRKAFEAKRSEINKRLYEKKGGSPSTEELEKTLDWRQFVKGKSLMSDLRGLAHDKSIDEKKIGRAAAGAVVAEDLLDLLAKILA